MSSISSTTRYVSAFLHYCLIATGLSTFAIGALVNAATAQENTPVNRPPTDGVATIAAKQPAPQYGFRYVDPQTGADTNTGSQQSPLRTLTAALQTAAENTIIVLTPGNYSAATGEQFPIVMRSGITIQGQAANRGQDVVIQGGGIYLSRTFARQNITLLGANRAGLRGVTVTNPEPQGYGLWIESTSPVISDNTFSGSSHDGVSIVGSSAPILKNNYFTQNGANGITIYGYSRPELIENTFENTGFGINIAQNATPQLFRNRITRNKDGIVVQGKAQPILRGNQIINNERDGLVAISTAMPHLGNQTDPGNNQFSGNGNLDINASATSQIIPNVGNQANQTRGQLDDRSTIAITLHPVRQLATLNPMTVGGSIAANIGSDTTEMAKPAITTPL
ncbi:MAG: DUF1565 domain-containing protein [Alkalinema sp. RL_2_19]|nr:DUF1565 domain-containing protein [Alkalinema sp. RL_2_19]